MRKRLCEARRATRLPSGGLRSMVGMYSIEGVLAGPIGIWVGTGMALGNYRRHKYPFACSFRASLSSHLL